MGWTRSLLALATASFVAGSSACAAELLMYRRAGCPWCLVWDREIGPIYGKTELGKTLKLREVDMGSGSLPNVVLKTPVRYSPTFVIVEMGREVARIEGYPGQDFFWGLLEGAARQLHSHASDGLSNR